MNFQVSILKVLASYPNRLARLPDIKRDLALLATSGADWASYSKRLGEAFPSLDVFSLGFVQRYSFGWRLTAKGVAALELMQQRVRAPIVEAESPTSDISLTEMSATTLESAGKPAQSELSPTDRRAQFILIDGGRNKAA